MPPQGVRQGRLEWVANENLLQTSTLWSGGNFLRRRAGRGMADRRSFVMFPSRRHGEQPLRGIGAWPLIGWPFRRRVRLPFSAEDISANSLARRVPAARGLPGSDSAHDRVDGGETAR